MYQQQKILEIAEYVLYPHCIGLRIIGDTYWDNTSKSKHCYRYGTTFFYICFFKLKINVAAIFFKMLYS